MAKKYIVTLTPEERSDLENLTIQKVLDQRKRKRAYVLLAVDQSPGGKNMRDTEASKAYDITTRSIENLRKRFVLDGIDIAINGLAREVNYFRKVDGELEARLIAEASTDPPEGFSRWTLSGLADRMVELKYVESLSYETVRQVLKKTS